MSDLTETGILAADNQNKKTLQLYHHLADEGYSKSDLAYMLPKGIIYRLVVTGNFRAWYEYLPKRLCQRATKEHCILAELLHRHLVDLCPEVFGRVSAPCSHCHERSCAFHD